MRKDMLRGVCEPGEGSHERREAVGDQEQDGGRSYSAAVEEAGGIVAGCSSTLCSSCETMETR